jgi:hypothetical protein
MASVPSISVIRALSTINPSASDGLHPTRGRYEDHQLLMSSGKTVTKMYPTRRDSGPDLTVHNLGHSASLQKKTRLVWLEATISRSK